MLTFSFWYFRQSWWWLSIQLVQSIIRVVSLRRIPSVPYRGLRHSLSTGHANGIMRILHVMDPRPRSWDFHTISTSHWWWVQLVFVCPNFGKYSFVLPLGISLNKSSKICQKSSVDVKIQGHFACNWFRLVIYRGKNNFYGKKKWHVRQNLDALNVEFCKICESESAFVDLKVKKTFNMLVFLSVVLFLIRHTCTCISL